MVSPGKTKYSLARPVNPCETRDSSNRLSAVNGSRNIWPIFLVCRTKLPKIGEFGGSVDLAIRWQNHLEFTGKLPSNLLFIQGRTKLAG